MSPSDFNKLDIAGKVSELYSRFHKIDKRLVRIEAGIAIIVALFLANKIQLGGPLP